jgi:endoglucanase
MDLKTLCEAQGLSGREEAVRRLVMGECERRLGKGAVSLDGTGSVIAVRKAARPGLPRVMLAAHMDEVGLIVVSATDDGLLRFRTIGGVDARVLVSKRVKVGYDAPDKPAVPGVIGAMAIHQQTPEDRKAVLPIDQLYVDIGAKDKAEAEKNAPPGRRSPSTPPFRALATDACTPKRWTTARACITCSTCWTRPTRASWHSPSPARRKWAAAARPLPATGCSRTSR